MGIFLRNFLLTLAFLGVSAIHLWMTVAFSYSYFSLNVYFVFLTFYLLLSGSGSVVWYAFLVFYIFEHYSSSPFGAILLSGVLTTLVTYFLYRNIFTNRSWYSAGILTALSVLIYWVCFFISTYIIASIASVGALSFSQSGLMAVREIYSSVLVVVLLFFFISRLYSSLGREKVTASWFKSIQSS